MLTVIEIAEIAFVLVGLVGLGLVSVPAALVLGAVLGVLACERASAVRRTAQAATEKKPGGGR